MTAPHAPPKLKPDDSGSSQKSSDTVMGNSESKKLPIRSATSPSPTPTSVLPAPIPTARSTQKKSEPGQSDTELFGRSHVPNQNVFGGFPDDNVDAPSPYAYTTSEYARPPRLPLPIDGQGEHAPGSPFLPAQDLDSPISPTEIDGIIPRRTSVLSSTTVDDDDMVDNDAFIDEGQGPSKAPTVPTYLEWRGGGEKLYVTGTWCNWEKKFKLDRHDSTGVFSAMINLQPGTHHLKFLVDDNMTTSNDLPTTVDYTIQLVNYIEVVAPLGTAGSEPIGHVKPSQGQYGRASPLPDSTKAEAIPASDVATTEDHDFASRQSAAKPLDIRPTAATPAKSSDPSPAHRATLPMNIAKPALIAQDTHSSSLHETGDHHPAPPVVAAKKKLPRKNYTSAIPAFMVDLDTADPNNPDFARAKRLEPHLPQPPSLPMFLGKSILNGTTPHKDDASVLIMPNHTVLNHLATSSIKSGVLATSGTTRYKRKVCLRTSAIFVGNVR